MPASFKHRPYIFLDDQIQKKSRLYQNPSALITAYASREIAPALARIDAALNAGLYVAGYASYELGLYLSKKLEPLAPKTSPSPLLCFGIFDSFSEAADFEDIAVLNSSRHLPRLTPDWSQQAYLSRFERIKTYIQNGDIYQANLTFPYSGKSDAAPDLPFLYKTLRGRQPVHYGAIVSLGKGPDILSLSPELFFKIDDGIISARPMKGTAARGATQAEDARIATAMQQDEKSRAENLMIVDLLRNDLSRLSQSGTVKVTDLFTLERYPTLHQMTSGIEAKLTDDLTMADIFKALFPCGSVTGAPKVRAMEIIHALESGPRGPYCGAIGYFDPHSHGKRGRANFNVAIRSLMSQKQDDHYALSYNVGSGIVADSNGAEEYAECLLKANIVTQSVPQTKSPQVSGLRETLKWSPKEGYSLYEQHMLRLMKAADQSGLVLNPIAAMTALDEEINTAKSAQRVGLTLHANGKISTTSTPLTLLPEPVRLSLSKTPLSSRDQALRLKSLEMRNFYDQELARIRALSGAHEVLFLNEQMQICEGSYSNLFIFNGETLYTPPLRCGLLPGLLRAHLLQTKRAYEKEISVNALIQAQAIYIGNSVRGLCRAKLISPDRI